MIGDFIALWILKLADEVQGKVPPVKTSANDSRREPAYRSDPDPDPDGWIAEITREEEAQKGED